eukprot:scaffold438_cov110-Isochrysis_galbana.AAC.2
MPPPMRAARGRPASRRAPVHSPPRRHPAHAAARHSPLACRWSPMCNRCTPAARDATRQPGARAAGRRGQRCRWRERGWPGVARSRPDRRGWGEIGRRARTASHQGPRGRHRCCHSRRRRRCQSVAGLARAAVGPPRPTVGRRRLQG